MTHWDIPANVNAKPKDIQYINVIDTALGGWMSGQYDSVSCSWSQAKKRG